MKKYFLATAIALTICSCQTGKELHYFRSGDNYYRLRINECTFLTSSRYLSGYFDEKAVNNYFDEIYRNEKTSLVSLSSKNSSSPTKLLLLLSTKSEAVSSTIGQLASGGQTLEIIAQMANQDYKKKYNELLIDSININNKIRIDNMNIRRHINNLNNPTIIMNDEIMTLIRELHNFPK